MTLTEVAVENFIRSVAEKGKLIELNSLRKRLVLEQGDYRLYWNNDIIEVVGNGAKITLATNQLEDDLLAQIDFHLYQKINEISKSLE